MEHTVLEHTSVPVLAQTSSFVGSDGTREGHLLLRPTATGSTEEQLDWLSQAYRDTLDSHGIATGTAVFRRFFCADLVNQAAALTASGLASRESPDEPCAVSWVQQPPAPPAKLAMWAYHIHAPGASLQKKLDGRTLTWSRDGLAHLWTTGIACPEAGGAGEQTRAVFECYAEFLRSRGLSLGESAIRTWLFIRDIDAEYEAVAAARRECFREYGLTAETHFIASTGIEGIGPDPRAVVTLDACAVGGLRPGQVRFLTAPEHLGPTHVYGVTFERGTAIGYRDRTQVIISGTASIDPQGRILHGGDVSRQLDRAMENIEALLSDGGAARRDLAILIAYVRNPGDQGLVRERLAEWVSRRTGGLVPSEVVVARICRPGWLVEVEGVAIVGAAGAEMPEF